MIPNWKIYPRSQGHSTVYLKNVVNAPAITVGDYTIYDDFANDPRDFQRNNVLYHYPECNHDRLTIGKFCSIACGARFLFNAANHTLGSLSTYPFPILFEEWGLPTDVDSIAKAWEANPEYFSQIAHRTITQPPTSGDFLCMLHEYLREQKMEK